MFTLADTNVPKDVKRKSIGEKAYNLYLINKEGLARTPFSWVIDSNYFLYCLKQNNVLYKIGCSDDFFLQMQKVRQRISFLECPEELSLEINKILDNCNGKIAVRSSFSFEDNKDSSNAGFFYSSMSNPTKEDIWNAILLTWDSAFSPLVKDEFSYEGINVLLQPYIQASMSGVAFSQSIFSKNELLICTQEGNLESLTAGESSGKEFSINRDQVNNIENYKLKELAKMIIKLEKYFNFPVDVEWLFDENGQLYILQCRPIKQKIEKRINDFEIINIDKWDIQNDRYLSDIEKTHKQWFVKKFWIRKFAIENGINVSDVYYIQVPYRGLCEDEVEQIKHKFNTTWIEICSDNIKRHMVLKSDLASEIIELKNITLRIESVIETFNAGIATYEVVTDIVITDMCPGSVNSIREGNLKPSSAVISSDNIMKKLYKHEEVKRFNNETGQWASYRNQENPFEISLTEKDFREVYRISRLFYDRFGKTHVEWIHDGRNVYFFDTSFEDESTSIVPKESRWISYGSVKAPVVVLKDVHELEKFWPDHISVWRPKDFFNIAATIKISNICKDYKYKNVKPIIVTEYPITNLALLISHVSGFVFAKGSVLCHFAIILRENGIPAIFDEDCMTTYNTNDWINLDDSAARGEL